MKKILFKYLRNKYILALIIFIVYAGFIDSNYSIFRHMQLKKTLNQLRVEKVFYEEEIVRKQILVDRLKNDIDFIEKYGRENHFLKRDNEVVFQIVPKD